LLSQTHGFVTLPGFWQNYPSRFRDPSERYNRYKCI